MIHVAPLEIFTEHLTSMPNWLTFKKKIRQNLKAKKAVN